MTRSFDVSFDLRLNKRLSKQSWDWWSETPSCQLWRHCNGICRWQYIHHIFFQHTLKRSQISIFYIYFEHTNIFEHISTCNVSKSAQMCQNVKRLFLRKRLKRHSLHHIFFTAVTLLWSSREQTIWLKILRLQEWIYTAANFHAMINFIAFALKKLNL